MGAAVANDDAISTIVPPSLTKDEGAHVGVSVAFEGVCVRGWGWRDCHPSVVIGGGGAVLDPAAERASFNCCAVPPQLLHGVRPISPSSSSCLCPPKTFCCCLPPLLIVKFPLAAGDCRCRRRCRHHHQAVALPPPPPIPTLTPLPPYCRRCHRHHASLTLPSCHCRHNAVAATATTAVALSCPRHRCRGCAPDASQLLLPSCCRCRHHRAEPAPQPFRRRCQAAVTATVPSTIAARSCYPSLPPPLPRCRRHTATAATAPLPSCHIQATAAIATMEMTAMADQASQATLNGVDTLQKNSSRVWYCGRGHRFFPP